MFCSNCGNNIADQSVCPFCGCPANPSDSPEAYPNAPQPIYPGAQTQPAYYGAANSQPLNYDRPPIAPASKPKKKKGVIIGVISTAVVLLAGGAIAVYFLVLQPLFSYNKAVELKDDGRYQEAIAAFTDLKDYKDSPDQITECRYLEAKQMLADGKFDEAIAAFTALDSYKDSRDQIAQCDYERAQKLFDEGSYDEAKSYFASLGDYKDSADRVTDCDYSAAKALMQSDPESAVKKLEQLGGYQDAEELVKQAKMNYCRSNKDSYDVTAFEYLKELRAISYPGASALYDELYTYHLTDVFWNDDPDDSDSSGGVAVLSKEKDQVLHFTLEGGTPDDTGMQIKYTITWPSGNTSSGSYDRRYRNYSLTLTNSVAGKLTVDIYTQDNTHLYTASVTVK